MNLWNQFVDVFSDILRGLANAFSFLGDHRWAAAIVALTLIIRTLLLPIAIRMIKSQREQVRLQPEIQKLRQKYAGDRQKQTEEMMALFRREGVNPYASCIPMIAQAPVFIGMYWALRHLTDPPKEVARRLAPIAKRTGVSVVELAQQRGIVPKMPLLGLADLAHPASSSVGGWLLIVLMTLAQLFSAMQLNVGQTEQQRRLQLLLPLFFTIFFIQFPAALVLYWATQTIYQLVQQLIMTRDMRPEGAGIRGLFASIRPRQGKGGRPKPRPAQPRPIAMPATSPASFEGMAPRRDLAEKRRRRRRKKRKKRR